MSKDTTEENDILISNNDEFSAIPIDYAPPDVDIADLINSKTPHLKLPICKEPVSAYELINGEEVAFPHLFPFGINGFKAEHEKNISPSFYFKHRLGYSDGRFRKKHYLFISCYKPL